MTRPNRALPPLLFLALWGCSAPDVATLPDPRRAPDEAGPRPPPGQPGPPPSASSAAAPARPPKLPPKPPPKPALQATDEGDMPEPPFTAWTAAAPLTLVGPGGREAVTLNHTGVRVEVLQILSSRTRVRCIGCTGDAKDVEAWVQPGRLRAAGAPGDQRDPLATVLRMRARWAAGDDLPEGASRAGMCRLADSGFTWTGEAASWQTGGGTLRLVWTGGEWRQDRLTAPTEETAWSCRTSGVARRPPR